MVRLGSGTPRCMTPEPGRWRVAATPEQISILRSEVTAYAQRAGVAAGRLADVRLAVSDVRRIRTSHGGTTNDVVLAVLAGALREWLINRGQRADGRSLRALIPVSVRARQAEQTGGNKLSGYLCELPIGIDDPLERLRIVRRAMTRNKAAGPARGAGAFPLLADKVPPAVHRLTGELADWYRLDAGHQSGRLPYAAL